MTTPSASRLSFRQIADWLGPQDRLAMLACAVLAFGLAAMRQSWPQAALLAPLAAAAAAIVAIDLRHYRIPDRLSLPLIPLGLIHAAFDVPLLPRLIAVAGVWAGLSVLQRIFLRLRGQRGLGGGDVKLIAAGAAWLPVGILPFYVLAASVTALIAALIRRANRHHRLAFGVHLAPWLVVMALAA